LAREGIPGNSKEQQGTLDRHWDSEDGPMRKKSFQTRAGNVCGRAFCWDDRVARRSLLFPNWIIEVQFGP